MQLHALIIIIIFLLTIHLTAALPLSNPLHTHQKGTIYCIPTPTKTCSYVWETFYNSTLPPSQRLYNKACIYSSTCRPVVNEVDAVNFGIQKQRPVGRAKRVNLPLYEFPLVGEGMIDGKEMKGEIFEVKG
jgi:hypothetical protein